jgi:predicted RNase H-like HicB family nuclease
MKYLTIINKSEYGYSVSVPALPGCHSQGKTKKEALGNIKDAILTYFAMSKEEFDGVEISEVEVAFPA